MFTHEGTRHGDLKLDRRLLLEHVNVESPYGNHWYPLVCPVMPVLAHSLSDVAANPFGRGFKKKAEILRYGRLDMLPRQISKSLINTVHSIWVSCSPFHTHHENGPHSFYSRIANSMTEKPPLDERQAKLIGVTTREIPLDRKSLRWVR